MRPMLRKIASVVAVAAVSLSLVACGGGDKSSGGSDASLTIGMPNGTISSKQFNPFLTSGMTVIATAPVYEPVAIVNAVDLSKDPEPWLASNIEWSDDYKSVKFTARDGVKWADGEDFTAEDIAYTYQLFVDHPELDLNAIGVTGTSVDGNVATVEFEKSMFVKTSQVLTKPIVAKHVWEKLDDVTALDIDLMGTGPYKLKQFSTEAVTLEARDDYWGGTPAVKTLYLQSFNDNTMLLNALGSGDVDWAQISQPPNVETAYINKDKEHNKNWAPSTMGVDMMYLNTAEKPFNNVAFRKAVNMVVDRAKHAQIAREGIVDPITSVTGLPTAGNTFIIDKYKGQETKVDVNGAKKILTDAGYSYQGDKLIDPDGEVVSFEISVPQGWTDYVTGISLIADEVKELGVDVNVKTPDSDTWTENVNNGKFGAILHWIDTGNTAYDFYSDVMDGRWLKPVGEAASYNFGRYDNEQATEALNTYANTTDETERQKALEEIETIWVEDVPAISLGNRPDTAQYNTRKFTGWPDDDNPYVSPNPTLYTMVSILAKLKAVK